MKLTLQNIGKIEAASVDICGITVIAGENNTGKSTVGRALFAVFNSFCNIQERIRKNRIESIDKILMRTFYNHFPVLFTDIDTIRIAKDIVSHIDFFRSAEVSEVQKEISNLISQCNEVKNITFNKNTMVELTSRIKDVLDVSDSDFLKSVLDRKLKSEFNEQICNIFSENDGEIKLCIKDSAITVSIQNDGLIKFQNPSNISLQTEVVYMDDPFVLDEQKAMYRHVNGLFSGHRYHLYSKLFLKDRESNLFDAIVVEEKLNKINEKISTVCSGNIITYKRMGFGYRRNNSDKVLNIRNLSTGLKTFIILKKLLMNGVIESNGTIILDEPEIHLHPEWQLLFAELIVLIQKEFGVHVLLNTHSPYFLNAIEVYAAKYGVNDKCKYYLASSQDDISCIEDVSNNVEAIYSKLARPLQDLENERGRL